MRALVVENEAIIAMMVAVELESAGWYVTCSFLAGEALDEINRSIDQRYPYDLAVIDLGLPDLPGNDLIKELRVVAPNLSLIVYTGYDFLAPQLEGVPDDVPVLRKPCGANDLILAAEAVIVRRAAFKA